MTEIEDGTPIRTQPAVRGAPGLAARFGYLLGGLPLGVVAFVVAVAGFSVGTATLVIWVGVPVLATTLWAARGLATPRGGRRGLRHSQPCPSHH